MEKHRGQPLLRIIKENGFSLPGGPEAYAPCRDPSRGCPKGTPENPNTLTEANRRCYDHYQERVAVNSFPNDPLVRQNARIIKSMIDHVVDLRETERHQELLNEIAGLK